MITTRAWWMLRLGVSASVLGALFLLLPLAELRDALAAVSPALMALVVLGFLGGHAVGAVKWRLLMGPLVDVPPAVWLRAHFAGLVANLCLPGVAGGDVVRAGWVIRRVARKEEVAVASLADRAIDVMALLALAGAGAIWAGGASGAGWTVVSVGALLGAVATGLTLVAWLGVRRPRTGLLGRVRDAVRGLAGRPVLLLKGLLLSLLVQAGFVALNARLGAAAGLEVGLAAWLVAWPLAKLVALIPITVAGFGVREAALVGFMRAFGAQPEGVLAAGLLWDAVLVAGGLVGWLATLGLRSGVAAPRARFDP